MSESPMFSKLKTEGKISANPLKESFGNKGNFKMVLLALFGAVMGQGVVWYSMTTFGFADFDTIKLGFNVSIFKLASYAVVKCKVGRKWIMLIGMLAAVLTYRPIYKQFLSLTNAKNRIEKIDLSKTTASEPKVVTDAKDNTKIYVTQVFDTAYTDGANFKYTKTDTLHLTAAYDASLKIDALNPSLIVSKSVKPNVVIEKTMDEGTYWNLIWLVFIQIVYVTMVYGPIAAFLVEMFPTKIRYTSMSLPYHIGNGVFGGLVPFLGTLIVEFTKSPESPMGDALAGLWYPIGVATVCLIIGVFYLSNKIDKNVMD